MHAEAESPLDCRVFTLAAASDACAPPAGSHVELLLPRRLAGGEVRWQVLGAGRLERRDITRGPGESAVRYRVTDTWAAQLERSVARVWGWLDATLLPLPAGGSLRVGDDANRSAGLHDVAGQRVHVLQPGGEPWLLGEALASFSAFYGLNLRLPAGLAVWDQPLREGVSLQRSAESVLRSWCETYGLVVQQTRRRVGGRVVAWRSLRPATRGRLISLPRAAMRGGDEAVRRVASRVTDRRPRRWVALGGRPIVESTFVLHPGWDPTLEGEPDDAYDRGASGDFSRYANVYRRWVLNEDGRDRGPTFDLAALFADVVGAAPTAASFGRCLTRDDAGQRLGPVVEVSYDGGATWSTADGLWALLEDRAGVYFDASALGSAFLAAAKAGAARVRVTATLTALRPIEAGHWRGNLFDEPGPPRTLDASALFAFRRVDPQSIHHAGLAAGQRDADERDDRDAMARWLVARIDEAGPGVGGSAAAELKLSGARPELRAGDRLSEVAAAGRDAAATPISLTELKATVAAVRCDFEPISSTRLTLRG
ncbi:MAG: hypothetical protein AAF800_09505 [Planctomycetota bacterium]